MFIHNISSQNYSRTFYSIAAAVWGRNTHFFFITGMINVMKSQIAKVKFDFDIFDSVLNTQNSILGWQWL